MENGLPHIQENLKKIILKKETECLSYRMEQPIKASSGVINLKDMVGLSFLMVTSMKAPGQMVNMKDMAN